MEVPGFFCAPFCLLCLLCLLCSLLYCSLSSFVLLAPSVAACRLSFVLLALSGLPAYSLLCSSLSPALSAYSLKLLLALPGYAPAGWAPLYVPPWVPSFCFFPIPGSRPWYPAAAQPTLFWALRSFRRCLPTLLSPSSLSPGVLRPGGPPVCPLLFPIPGSRP